MKDRLINTTIRIKGRDYQVKGPFNSRIEAMEIANFLENKMEEIEKKMNIVSTDKLLIATALNIAAEFFKLKNEYEKLRNRLDKKLNEALDIVVRIKKGED